MSNTSINNKNNKLLTENVGKLIWDYSLPAVVGTIAMSLYNIVDRIFIGQGVGPLALSGLALAFPIMIILMAFGLLVGVGASSRISISMGEGNHEKSEKILSNTFTLTILISGTAIFFAMIFMDDILRLFGSSDNTLQYAREYLQIIIPGGVFTALYFGFNNIIRSSGFPRKAMYSIIFGAVLNALLDPLFIFVFDWGIKGAAWATVISYFAGTIWVMSHFFSNDSNLRFKRSYFKLEKDIVFSIISIGMSPFAMQVGTSLVVVIVNSTLLKYGGDLAIGAYGIINSINILVVMFIIGLNQGTQPIVGYNFGAGKYDRMFSALKISIITGTALSTIGFVIGVFFAEPMVALFTTDAELRAIASNALFISVLMFPLIGSQIVASNFFQSIGKAKISIFLSLTRQFFFLIPSILILPLFMGLDGAWATMPVSDALSTIVSWSTLFWFIKKFKKKHYQQ